MYIINRYTADGTRIDRAEFNLLPEECLLDKLEEVLYILYEEEPISRYWQWELAQEGVTCLSYHNLEFSTIKYNKAYKTFTIIED